jgi:transposase
MGVSGRAMLDRLVAGQTDPQALATLAKGRLRSKHEALKAALEGRMRPVHRVLLKTQLGLIDGFDAAIEALTAEIEERMRPFLEIRDRLDKMSGIGPDVATTFISEMGIDMTRWPTCQHAASWAGFCPGHHESAGKRKSGRTRNGNRWLKQAFVQAAWSAQRANGTYMQAHFRRICARRGAKKAAGAVAHSLFVRCYQMVATGSEYNELGGTYFDQRRKDAVRNRLVKRLEGLGYHVTLAPQAA